MNDHSRCMRLGSGVEVVREPAVVERVPKSHPYPWVRITQKITLTLEVPIGVPRYCCCAACGKAPPWPDAAGAEFILENSDGDRLCFPSEEDVRPERDCYPVTGWKKIVVKDEQKMICADCSTALDLAVAARMEELRKAGEEAGGR